MLSISLEAIGVCWAFMNGERRMEKENKVLFALMLAVFAIVACAFVMFDDEGPMADGVTTDVNIRTLDELKSKMDDSNIKTIKIVDNIEIKKGETVEIDAKKTITISKNFKLTNNGVLTSKWKSNDGKECEGLINTNFIIEGTFENNGYVYGAFTIKGECIVGKNGYIHTSTGQSTKIADGAEFTVNGGKLSYMTIENSGTMTVDYPSVLTNVNFKNTKPIIINGGLIDIKTDSTISDLDTYKSNFTVAADYEMKWSGNKAPLCGTVVKKVKGEPSIEIKTGDKSCYLEKVEYLDKIVADEDTIILHKDITLDDDGFYFSKSVTLDGNKHTISGNVTTERGVTNPTMCGIFFNGKGKIFNITNTTFKNIVYEGCVNRYAVAIWNAENAIVENCLFENNDANYILDIHDDKSFVMKGCTFKNNIDSHTVPIDASGGSTTEFSIYDCLFEGNISSTSVFYNNSPTGVGVCKVEGCTFKSNVIGSGDNGATLYLSRPATITGCLFEGNTTKEGISNKSAGAICTGSNSTGTIINGNVFKNNQNFNTNGTSAKNILIAMDGFNLNSNYFDDGKAPSNSKAGNDIWIKEKTITYVLDTYANSYKTVGNGVITEDYVSCYIGDAEHPSLVEGEFKVNNSKFAFIGSTTTTGKLNIVMNDGLRKYTVALPEGTAIGAGSVISVKYVGSTDSVTKYEIETPGIENFSVKLPCMAGFKNAKVLCNDSEVGVSNVYYDANAGYVTFDAAHNSVFSIVLSGDSASSGVVTTSGSNVAHNYSPAIAFMLLVASLGFLAYVIRKK